MAEKIKISAGKIQNSNEKIQKITNGVDWILSKGVSDVITTCIALTKIPEREESISPSSFYGQLPGYQPCVLTLIYSVGEFSFMKIKTWDQSKISSYCFMFGVNQEI